MARQKQHIKLGAVCAFGNRHWKPVGVFDFKQKKRALGATEARINLFGGLLAIYGAVFFFFPRVPAIPLGIIFVWLAVSLFINAFQLFRQEKK